MQRTPIRLHLTSYGPFLHITENPSQKIGERLEPLCRAWTVNDSDPATDADGNPIQRPQITSLDHRTLEVSIEAVDQYFAELQAAAASSASAEAGREDEEGAVDVYVHMGVAPGNDGILRAEVRGYNELHCPQGDFQGVCRSHEPISCDEGRKVTNTDPTASGRHLQLPKEMDQRCFEYVETEIPLEWVSAAVEAVNARKQALQEAGPRDHGREDDGVVPGMVVSRNAGRYLCNYCTYRSMQFASAQNQGAIPGPSQQTPRRRCLSMFVHVLDPQYVAWRGGEEGVGGAVGAERSNAPQVLHNPSFDQQAECIAHLLEHILRQLQCSP